MARIVCLVFALAGIIFVRSHLPGNIAPWEPLWILWVGSTCLIAGCLGWVANDVRHRRNLQKPAQQPAEPE